MRLRKLSAILLFCLCSISQARAGATLFLGEPYGYDGWLAGTGHAAVYLSHVCATSPIALRLCAPGETGIVISRYSGVAGYDWIAIPLIPYLYGVEKQEDVPLFADAKLVAFLRDHYRRTHLGSLAPDLPDSGTPAGGWYELIGASYIRTIYAFEIETSPEQDARLIRKLNSRPNRQRWNLVTANCADFVREVINFYYPHTVHRSIISDLGITTPKQSARMLSNYSRHHPELQTSTFVIPQVPGTVPRSRPVHSILECALTAKKYMLPLFLLHPYIAGSLVAGYLVRGHFNPAKNALIFDSKHQLEAPLTPADRRAFQDRLEDLVQTASPADTAADERRHWASLHATAEPILDASGGPTLQLNIGGEVTPVGIARANILRLPDSYEFAAGLVKARLREELKPAASRKTARSDFENDLALLQKLLAQQPTGFASTAGSHESDTQSAFAAQ
ncbi:MAG: hypothetical protein WA847_06575 [Terriglobales bacterium]